MNYRIDYAPRPDPVRRRPAGKLAAAALALLLLGSMLLLPSGSAAVRTLVLPEGPTPAQAAGLLRTLAAGTPPGRAVTAFCREVIADAALP